jgi:putative membrane protein
VLFGVFVALWLALAIEPRYRQDWALENVLVAIAAPLLVWQYRHWWRFSSAAYACLFVFFSLHIVGAHHTYSEVPYDEWARSLTGHSIDHALGFERNHYDRLVHFAYGFLLALPAIELLDRRAPPRGPWRWLLPVLFIASHSVIYEMIEWIAAIVFGGELGVAYLGTQGDEWDAQKDMGLASLGAMIGVTFARLMRPSAATLA